MVETASRLHKVFNQASVARVGLDFDDFLDSCLSVGALGVVVREDARYVEGEFSYTTAEGVRPVEDRDQLCVHPLFMYRWFDRRAMAAMAARQTKAIYPYGSDLSHEDHTV